MTKVPRHNGIHTSVLGDLLKMGETPVGSLPGSDEVERLIYERYVKRGRGADWKLRAYYEVRPLLPRRVQLLLRKNYKAKQEISTFPAWPIESAVADAVQRALMAAAGTNGGVHRIAFWPGSKKFAFAITHDVEWEAGLRIAPTIAALDRKYGFASSFNIVPERYPIDWSIVSQLREMGCEIGVHGLKHDGKLFLSRRIFRKRLELIHRYAREWGAVGFRSPATLRRLEWMPELKFEYDSSFFDTDPYEPQPGGCCSIWPYFIDDLLEMPMTLPQDHTLFEILGYKDIGIWVQKAEWIAAHGGMVLINVHPDYMDTEERLGYYEAFLKHMRNMPGIWNALPRDIAVWWKNRSKSTLLRKNDTFVVEGPAADAASVLESKVDNGMLVDRIAA